MQYQRDCCWKLVDLVSTLYQRSPRLIAGRSGQGCPDGISVRRSSVELRESAGVCLTENWFLVAGKTLVLYSLGRGEKQMSCLSIR